MIRFGQTIAVFGAGANFHAQQAAWTLGLLVAAFILGRVR